MTARTLEEIEVEWGYVTVETDGDTDWVQRRYWADLLAIAQEQRAEIARLRAEINGWQNDHPFPG